MKRLTLVPTMLEHRASALDRKALKLATLEAVTPPPAQFDFSDRVVSKPWGYEYPFYLSGSSAMWLLHLRPGQMTSMHCHVRKTTTLIVLDGSIKCRTLSSEADRFSGQGARIGMKAFHQSEAGADGAILLEVEAPVDKYDLVRLKDTYGRQRLGYEGPESTQSMPSGHRTLSEPPPGSVWEQIVGRSKVSIYRPGDPSAPAPPKDHLVCVLKGGAMDVEAYCLIGVGDCLDSKSIGRRISRWHASSIVAVISS